MLNQSFAVQTFCLSHVTEAQILTAIEKLLVKELTSLAATSKAKLIAYKWLSFWCRTITFSSLALIGVWYLKGCDDNKDLLIIACLATLCIFSTGL